MICSTRGLSSFHITSCSPARGDMPQSLRIGFSEIVGVCLNRGNGWGNCNLYSKNYGEKSSDFRGITPDKPIHNYLWQTSAFFCHFPSTYPLKPDRWGSNPAVFHNPFKQDLLVTLYSHQNDQTSCCYSKVDQHLGNNFSHVSGSCYLFRMIFSCTCIKFGNMLTFYWSLRPSHFLTYNQNHGVQYKVIVTHDLDDAFFHDLNNHDISQIGSSRGCNPLRGAVEVTSGDNQVFPPHKLGYVKI